MAGRKRVNAATLALRWGISPQAVWDLVKRGKLTPPGPDNLFDFELADAEYWSNVRPRMNDRAPAAPVGGPSDAAGDDAAAGEASGGSYRASRSAREFYAAERERLAYEREVGSLLVRDDVVAAARHAATLVRTQAEQLAERLPARIAALGGDEAGIRALLVAEVEGYLWQIERAYGAIAQTEAAA